jgi:hypothetical protein
VPTRHSVSEGTSVQPTDLGVCRTATGHPVIIRRDVRIMPILAAHDAIWSNKLALDRHLQWKWRNAMAQCVAEGQPEKEGLRRWRLDHGHFGGDGSRVFGTVPSISLAPCWQGWRCCGRPEARNDIESSAQGGLRAGFSALGRMPVSDPVSLGSPSMSHSAIDTYGGWAAVLLLGWGLSPFWLCRPMASLMS